MRWNSDEEVGKVFPSAEAGRFGRRLRTPRGARLPVIVVTGFLGAGKTTLISRLLETPEGANSAVVVNEYGEVGIDHALLRDSTEETVLLGNGCLCCSMRSDLENTLRTLFIERMRGEIPSFQRVIIETSGLADVGPILSTFAQDKALAEEFHVDAVIAVVDAVNGAVTLENMEEARRQAALADRFIVTKTDLAAPAEAAHLRERLSALNPRARIEAAREGTVDPDYLLDPADPVAEAASIEMAPAHDGSLGTFTLRFDQPFSWEGFSRAVDTLTSLRGPDLLRVKGLVAVQGCVGPVALHVVQHIAHPPVELRAWPDDDHSTRIVFITRNITREEVAPLFEAVARLESGRSS